MEYEQGVCLLFCSENQQLITEIVGYVKSGDGIGWLSTKRLRRIAMFEGLRQYLINQIDIEQKSYQNTLNDVVSEPTLVYLQA